MKAIADTGFIVAFARRNDEYHSWAVDVAKRVTEPLLTCEAVLARPRFTWNRAPMCCLWWKTSCCVWPLIALGTFPSCRNWRGATPTASQTLPICA